MTKNINPTDETFENLRSVCGFSNQEIVELTATVSAYNFASRTATRLQKYADASRCEK
ncbi:hypothetical protein NOF04DRAFT_19286 [Fusarium oxysporum II5]|uniref:Uncharacterized protein n=1 Tax=Fusarium odoratissimum (strain NRRL 54006) TaxID=1089451 RepID=X0K1L0_FUSO5|nr:uncharacterized protein FOIG_15854 [Fusarium odoratissimum NRRL 54006]EXL90954.1 hypothetical protein FOIG_15854 [Fusarium odoratissimum NRRL 54006]KAK2123317.1 hypothetical protein NOF04DRAFT_19286 [Fusarium oxysporum II5]